MERAFYIPHILLFCKPSAIPEALRLREFLLYIRSLMLIRLDGLMTVGDGTRGGNIIDGRSDGSLAARCCRSCSLLRTNLFMVINTWSHPFQLDSFFSGLTGGWLWVPFSSLSPRTCNGLPILTPALLSCHIHEFSKLP